MTNERRLGRGLEALLGPNPTGAVGSGPVEGESAPDVVMPESTTATGGLLQLSVYEIDTNPYQPRTIFDEDEIASLSASLQEHGLLQPIVVRRDGQRYQLISGERRWRAAIRAGWAQIAATVRDVDDRQVAEMTIVENLQRKDLGPLEKAASFQEYLRRYECTQEELARRLSIDRSTIANLIRLLELPESVRDALSEKKITAGHARALLPLGDEAEQIKYCRAIQADQWSVRATEQSVSDAIRTADAEPLQVVGGGSSSASVPNARKQHLASLEQELRTALGAKVEIRQSAKGRGKITVYFTSHEEFDRLRSVLDGTDAPQSRAG